MDEKETVLGPDDIAEEGGGTLSVLAKAEINQQIATAKQYPRSVTSFMREAEQLVTMNEEMARQCVYSLPRGGKVIEGPSARFAEVMAYSFRNMRFGARPLTEDDEFTTSQGVAYDLERNNGISFEVRRRITDKNGSRFNADMIGVTSNAASSIALRNAVLKIIPKALWNPIYQKARHTIMGDYETFNNRLGKMFESFQRYGVSKEMLCAKIGKQGVADIKIEDLVPIAGMLTALQEGETTPEELFAQTAQAVQQPKAKPVDQPEPKQPEQPDAKHEGKRQTSSKAGKQEKQPEPHKDEPGAPNATTATSGATANMLKQIELRIQSYEIDRGKLLGNFGITKLEELQASQVNDVLKWIEENA